MTPITINGDTLVTFVLVCIAVAGWWVAYVKNKAVIQIKTQSEEGINLLTNSYSKDRKEVEDRHRAILSELQAKAELDKVTYEASLNAALETRENELVEAEEIIKERIKKIEDVYSEALDEQNESLELYEDYIRNFDAALTLSEKKLKDLDKKGSFNSDDEIGFFFRSILDLQTALNNFKIKKEVIDKEHVEKTEPNGSK